MNLNHNPILITAGDPGGIGYEILLKSLPMIDKKGWLKKVILIANPSALEFYDRILGGGQFYKKVAILPVGASNFTPFVGKDHEENGKIAIDSLHLAIQLIKEKKSNKLLTGPISKKAVVLAGYPHFTGHTSFLAKAFNIQNETMVLANQDFAVSLVTVHCPLSQVPLKANKESLSIAVKNTALWSKKQGYNNEPLWVCGLNPHAGEEGELGQEEQEWIIPTLKKLEKEGYFVKGPYPADALFKKAATKEGKFFIAMYHDQGLIPVKMLGKNQTVNITLGLPFFRISVEHGTAYDIVAQNKADNTSFLTAFDMTCNFNKN